MNMTMNTRESNSAKIIVMRQQLLLCFRRVFRPPVVFSILARFTSMLLDSPDSRPFYSDNSSFMFFPMDFIFPTVLISLSMSWSCSCRLPFCICSLSLPSTPSTYSGKSMMCCCPYSCPPCLVICNCLLTKSLNWFCLLCISALVIL